MGTTLVSFKAQETQEEQPKDGITLKGWFEVPIKGSGSTWQTEHFPFVTSMKMDFTAPKYQGPSQAPSDRKSNDAICISTKSELTPLPNAVVKYDFQTVFPDTPDTSYPLWSETASYNGELLEGRYHGKGTILGRAPFYFAASPMLFELSGHFLNGQPTNLCRLKIGWNDGLSQVQWTAKWRSHTEMVETTEFESNSAVSKAGYVVVPPNVSLGRFSFIKSTEEEQQPSTFSRSFNVIYHPRYQHGGNLRVVEDHLQTRLHFQEDLSSKMHKALMRGGRPWFGGHKWLQESPRFHYIANTYSLEEANLLRQNPNAVLISDLPVRTVQHLKYYFAAQSPTSIGYGADCYLRTGPYNRLVLDAAFKLKYFGREYPYMTARSLEAKPHIQENVRNMMRKEREKFPDDRMHHAIKITNDSNMEMDRLAQEYSDFSLGDNKLDKAANEHHLFHGSPSLFSTAQILKNGFETDQN